MTRVQRTVRLMAMAALLSAGPAAAQEGQETVAPDPDAPVRQDPLGTRLVNTPTPYTLGSRRLEIVFTHRFHQTVQDGDESNLWGLDSGADVGIGFTYGVASRLDLGLYRSSFQENFEASAKYLVAEQSQRMPFSLGVRAGANLVTREGAEDAERPFVQLLLVRRFAPGVNLVLSPSWVRDTPQLRNAFNVPVGITVPFGTGLVELEWIPANQDLEESQDAWHVALSQDVGGHIFEVVVGNSRATTVDQYMGGDFAGGFETGDVRLGFNLIRYWDF
jgi:uncharacterized beta barrel domain-containing protein DUF5777